MFVSVFSLLVHGIYNKNTLNSQHLFVFLSTLVMVHPIVSGVWLGPLGFSPTLDLSQARHSCHIDPQNCYQNNYI